MHSIDWLYHSLVPQADQTKMEESFGKVKLKSWKSCTWGLENQSSQQNTECWKTIIANYVNLAVIDWCLTLWWKLKYKCTCFSAVSYTPLATIDDII